MHLPFLPSPPPSLGQKESLAEELGQGWTISIGYGIRALILFWAMYVSL